MKLLRRLLCKLTGHRLVIVRGPDPEDSSNGLPVYGRNCRCGRRWTIMCMNGTEKEVML